MGVFTPDRRGIGALLRSGTVQGTCLRIGVAEAARIAAATPIDSGDTRASTRVEPADFGDRKGAVIIQDGAAVQLNWGNARTAAVHQATRGR